MHPADPKGGGRPTAETSAFCTRVSNAPRTCETAPNARRGGCKIRVVFEFERSPAEWADFGAFRRLQEVGEEANRSVRSFGIRQPVIPRFVLSLRFRNARRPLARLRPGRPPAGRRPLHDRRGPPAERVAAAPKPALQQLAYDQSEGYLRYERDVSRDSNALKPQKPGDTPARYLLNRLGHAYEVYPLFAIVGFWLFLPSLLPNNLFCFTDWERLKDGKYAKLPTVFWDLKGVTHQRLPIMEQLQDEMLEAAKKRGTR
ncbi:hypothetical protein M3Y99_00732500 [Aphelenchoides fujianensis]|nr:hypothetical protein M3Y99_00732500 [Aphelenchoides fujianensis]